MPQPLAEIHNRLRTADLALARIQGGSSELAHLREATGSLLVALSELVKLVETRTPAPPRARSGPAARHAPLE